MGELSEELWGEVLVSGDLMEGLLWRWGGTQVQSLCIPAHWELEEGLWLWGVSVGTGITQRT